MSYRTKEKDHVGDWILFAAIIAAVGGTAFLLSSPEQTPIQLSVETVSWIGIAIAGGLIILLIIFVDIIDKIIDKLFNRDPDNNFSPKGIFDHIRNYLIIALMFYMSLALMSPGEYYMFLTGLLIAALCLLLVLVNFAHGQRAVAAFLEGVAAGVEMNALRRTIWHSRAPRLIAYCVLPITATIGVLQVHLLQIRSGTASAVVELLCAGEDLPPDVKRKHCP